MNATEFEEHALELVASGFSPLVIAPRCEPRPDERPVPDVKAPGLRNADGSCVRMSGRRV
jgi:hypothetical protein